jgi:hypothetical protein
MPDIRGSEPHRLYVHDGTAATDRGATNRLEIVARARPHEFAIRTTTGPTPFLYRYRFAVANSKTVVQLDAQVELDGVAALMPQLARLAVKHGVADNLRIGGLPTRSARETPQGVSRLGKEGSLRPNARGGCGNSEVRSVPGLHGPQ